MYCLIDNEIMIKEKAQISIDDRSVLYGENIFETILKRDDTIIELDKHISRLILNLKQWDLNKFLKNELKEKLKRLTNQNNYKSSIIKIIVTGGIASRGLRMKEQRKPKLIITEDSYIISRNQYNDGVTLSTCEMTTNSQNIKMGGNYLNSILRLSNTSEDDLLYYDSGGKILETTIANIFFIKDKKIIMPTSKNILFGITANTIKRFFDIREKDIQISELDKFDEVFITNSVLGIMPVKKINNTYFKSNKISKEVSELYWRNYKLKSPF
jgi:4-amino-4-deoxychorismate lyase